MVKVPCNKLIAATRCSAARRAISRSIETTQTGDVLGITDCGGFRYLCSSHTRVGKGANKHCQRQQRYPLNLPHYFLLFDYATSFYPPSKRHHVARCCYRSARAHSPSLGFTARSARAATVSSASSAHNASPAVAPFSA